jgi:cAMP-specific phosphodiesterase 4
VSLRCNCCDSLILLANGLHCADLGNPCKPLSIYLNWTERLIEEFHRQGDREKELGLSVSLMMDRHKPNVERSQIGFIDVICQPLWETLAEITPELTVCMQYLEQNRQHWYTTLPPATPRTQRQIQQTSHQRQQAAGDPGLVLASSTVTTMAMLAATNPAFVVPMS